MVWCPHSPQKTSPIKECGHQTPMVKTQCLQTGLVATFSPENKLWKGMWPPNTNCENPMFPDWFGGRILPRKQALERNVATNHQYPMFPNWFGGHILPRKHALERNVATKTPMVKTQCFQIGLWPHSPQKTSPRKECGHQTPIVQTQCFQTGLVATFTPENKPSKECGHQTILETLGFHH